MLNPFHRARFSTLLLVALLVAGSLRATPDRGPLTFEFAVPPIEEANPFARELWGHVIQPSGKTIALPAYYVGRNHYAVRARPDEAGTYRLDAVTEASRTASTSAMAFKPRGNLALTCTTPIAMRPITRDPKNPHGFSDAHGEPYVPFGSNLAWAHGDLLPYYRHAFRAFAAANLNWMRVWMSHWGHLNLDWLPPAAGSSPKIGSLDPHVAEHWDQLLALAARHGVYIQLVLQHHGQYSTTVNPNWSDHPWNVAHPSGFLQSPTNFFTDERARALTRQKYRYIVARYGWSPAIFAWELFNEVHWVDALKLEHREADVARWHDEMAAFIRSVDAYQHLVTTSTEDLDSPIYRTMDFYQPHLYPANLIAATRTFATTKQPLERPIFYGEFGSDNAPFSDEEKKSALSTLLPIWAGLMGHAHLPAQPWVGWQLLELTQLPEIGAVRTFFEQSGFAHHPDLKPFSAVVETEAHTPLVLSPSQHWQRHPEPDFTLPLDGREPLELADLPAVLVSPASHDTDGFPARATFRAEFPRDTALRIQITEVGADGGALRILIDGDVAAERKWAPPTSLPDELSVPISAGLRVVTLENPGGLDWVRIGKIDLGLQTSPLAAIGRRNDQFVTLLVRHRTLLSSSHHGTAPLAGVLVIDDLPAGTWNVTWWNPYNGNREASSEHVHLGGPLRLPTPSIASHAVVVLQRSP